MTTIIFTANNATIEVESAHLNDDGDTILTEKDTYDLFSIKSIIPPKQKAPTPLQEVLTAWLQTMYRYVWDKQHSIASAGVVMKRADGDFWFFGMKGEIMHNPDGIKITL